MDEAASHEAPLSDGQAEMTGVPDMPKMEVCCSTQLSKSSAGVLIGRL